VQPWLAGCVISMKGLLGLVNVINCNDEIMRYAYSSTYYMRLCTIDVQKEKKKLVLVLQLLHSYT
jgi:hypothetical protein